MINLHVFQVFKNAVAVYGQRRILAVLCLGFSSGLPLALTASTLTAWLFESGVDKSSIGLFASVATPYTLKFLWAPLIDGLRLPLLCTLLGRRRGWLIATQIACAACILALGIAGTANLWLVAFLALLIAVCSASQDIVIDAYRVEILTPEQQGAGAAAVVLGYRFGMIASTAGALYLAEYTSWFFTYAVMGALMGVGILTVLFAGEPATSKTAAPPSCSIGAWLTQYVAAPLGEFMKRPNWWVLLLFILLYKLADAFIGGMTNPFLLEIGFAKDQIAGIVKFYGLIATIAGSFLGGALVYRIGALRSLWICGIAHALTNLMFVVQAKVGADTGILALGITMENLSGGMGTAAFVAFMSGLCNLQFTATQYALLSSFSAFGRTWLATPAGWVAEKLGWEWFFIFATLLAIPGLVVLAWMQSENSRILRLLVKLFAVALIAGCLLWGALHAVLYYGFG